jgi:signal transduction histidine kinase
MISAPIPRDETARLKELHQSGLLDSPQEAEFDEIVQFASSLCDMPISLISLVDSNRQWFKARVGLDETETSRDISFCAHAIMQEDLFEVPDTWEDIRFSDNPLVIAAPEIRFYAGMPLVTSNGSRLGTLCVIDREPGRLDEKQRFGLKVLANNVIKIAELRVKNKQLYYATENQKRIISILAHDVRNPLASIKNIIELNKSEVLDKEDTAEMMGMVNTQLKTTIEMVENVVNWGQLQLKFGSLNLADFDLHSLANRIFGTESLKSLAKNNKLINKIIPDTYIHSDEVALEFVLRNLISNANKYTGHGTISIDMERKGIKVVLSVCDTGIGMTEKQAADLLNNNSYRSTLGTNKEKGSGLGIMLAKEFIERLDGTITVESTPGKGTCFKIVI